MKMESPRYYLEPYQVFILKKLLLQYSKNEEMDKVYSYEDYQYYKDTGSVEILKYLSDLSTNQFFSIKEPKIIGQFIGLDLLRGLSDTSADRILEKIAEKSILLNEINTAGNRGLAIKKFDLLIDYIATKDPNERASIYYEGELHFKVRFNKKEIESLKKHLDDYIAAFVNGELISKEPKNYLSYQASAAIFKKTFGRLRKIMGINLNITEQLFYKDTVDYFKDVLKEMIPPSENGNFDQIRFWETLIAMEKEGYLKIISIYSKTPINEYPLPVAVKLNEKLQLENGSNTKEQEETSSQTGVPEPSEVSESGGEEQIPHFDKESGYFTFGKRIKLGRKTLQFKLVKLLYDNPNQMFDYGRIAVEIGLIKKIAAKKSPRFLELAEQLEKADEQEYAKLFTRLNAKPSVSIVIEKRITQLVANIKKRLSLPEKDTSLFVCNDGYMMKK